MRLVLVLSLLLPLRPGQITAARADLDEQPYKAYFPFVSADDGKAACQLVYQDPKDGSSKTRSQAFDVRWTLRNTGTTSWLADTVTIRFMSGDRMHSGNDLRDLPYDVAPGGMLDLVISMTAPAAAGVYTSNWALANGATALCSFYVQIRVP